MVLHAQPNQNLATNKYPLLNDQGTDMNARTKYIVGQIFEKYSIEDEKNPGRRIMGEQ